MAWFWRARGRRGSEMQEIRIVHVPGQDGHHPHDDQRHDHQEADVFLNVGGARDTAMLDRESDQHEGGPDEEGRIDGKGHRTYRLRE